MDSKLAEQYFRRAVSALPRLRAYLALGDLYTSQRNFHAAESEYENAYQRMPTSAWLLRERERRPRSA